MGEDAIKMKNKSDLTLSFPGAASDFALCITNGKRDWIHSTLKRIIDQLCIGLDTAEPVLQSTASSIASKSLGNICKTSTVGIKSNAR